ncbi:MAG: hypothetical protein AABX16_00470 [Nanoarchaeota archaeon]
MVEETNFKGKIVFKCMKCGYLYRDKSKAIECEEWCNRSKSCNLSITKYAIKMH